MAPPPVDLPPTAFYQAVATIFAVLLLSGVVTEMRALGESDERERTLSLGEIVRLFLFSVMCLLLLAGEIVTLNVLADPPVRDWQHRIITVALLVGLVAVPTMTYAQVLERLPRTARRPALIGGAGALTMALVAIVLLLRTAGDFRLGDWHIPKLFATRVYGTCAAGGCGLHMHTRPNQDAPTVGELLADGTRVYVVCQRRGRRISTPDGKVSHVWDRLANGGWVSDLYLETPAAGDFSPEIERC